MKLVIAGGTGSLGQRVANTFAETGDDVVILTRSPRPETAHRQVIWDGRNIGEWAGELDGAVLLNLAGELVDRPPTTRNVELLRQSRVEPTRVLLAVANQGSVPALWLQMSTLAIYGDAGQAVIEEGHPPAEELSIPRLPGRVDRVVGQRSAEARIVGCVHTTRRLRGPLRASERVVSRGDRAHAAGSSSRVAWAAS